MSREELVREGMEYGEKFKDFIRNYRDETGRFKYMERLRRMINYNQVSLLIEFSDLYRYDTGLAEELVENPIEVLKEASEAIRELVALEDPEYAERKGRFIPRILGLFETMSIRDLRSEHVGKLVQIDGIITRMHPIRSRLVKARFRHEKCKMEFDWPLDEDEVIGDRIEKPTICPACGEGGGKFILLQDKSKYIDWQKIVVQERPEDVPGGQMPRGIEVHLVEDLVDIARPGDRVTIVGIPRLEQTRSLSPLFELYIEANSVRVSEKVLEEVSISREDEEAIKELAMDPWIREKIVASIAPSIYGQWDLKEAIALLLFSGIPKTMPDGTRIRGDIHVLFIGDPGVAKSLTYSEHIVVIDRDGAIDVKPIGELVDHYMEKYRDYVVSTSHETEYLPLDLVGEELYTIAISQETFKPAIKRVKALIRHKSPDKVVVVKTKYGRRASITKNHSIMALEEDTLMLQEMEPYEAFRKRAKIPSLRSFKGLKRKIYRYTYIGDRVVELDWDMGYMTGVFLGKGTITSGKFIEISLPRQYLIEKMQAILHNKMINTQIYKVKNSDGEIIHKLVITDEDSIKWFETNFYKGETKAKKIPSIVYNAPTEFIRGFIRGLIDSTGMTLRDGSAIISTSNIELLYGITLALSILGLGYTIIDKPNVHGYYRIHITDNYNHNLLYVEGVQGRTLDGWEASVGDSQCRTCNTFTVGNPLHKSIGNEGTVVLLNSEKATVIDENVFWDSIEDLEEVDIRELEPDHYEYVYDISVEELENFAGGIGLVFLHNSQLLQSAARIAPRAVFTSGKGSTAAGLTAAVIQDKKTGEYYLEAGALVLADGGVAIIDEIDKMRSEDRVAIHEAMEQQVISISKAGIVARLNARASVLAAGNPKYGLYDPTRSFTDNVNLPPTILSRFDLIFVVRDIVNMERDRELARYILEAHSDFEKFKPEIDPQLLKKYIIYARRYVRPKLTPQAKKLIEDFFVEMRGSALQHTTREEGQMPIPITARQLEAIVRLAEAHAKMALKDNVTEEDAEEAIRITSSFLESVGLDLETGAIDVGIIMTGASFHTRKLMTMIVDEIKRLIESESRRCVKEDEIVRIMAESTKASEEKIKDAVRRLYQEGIIYMVKTDCYRVA